MNDERAIVVPTGVVTIGTRVLDMPRGRRALCVSCILPFRIDDGVLVEPKGWFGAVASHAGPMTIPDSTAPSCRFEECDFTSALFHKTVLDGARFARSTFVTSMWRETSAREAWFLACSLLSVDMRGVELLRAVFTDSDMEAAQLDFERTIGADFRGTVLEGR